MTRVKSKQFDRSNDRVAIFIIISQVSFLSSDWSIERVAFLNVSFLQGL